MDPRDLAKLVLVSNPALAGDKGYFVATRINLKRDRYESSIWEIDVSSREARVLLPGPTDIAPLPKGSRIAFLSRRGLGKKSRGMGLWVLERGGAPRRLAYFPLGVLDFGWSPDGSRLVVVAYRGKPEPDVKHVEGLPLWVNDFGYAYNVESHLYLVDAQSGLKVQITEGWARVKHASWSPDGRYVAYTVAKDQLRPYLVDLVVYDVRTKEHKTLAKGLVSDHHIAWSPKSDAIAVLGHKMQRGFSSHNRVYVYWLDGTERCLTCGFDRNAVNTLNSDVRGPSYSQVVQWSGDFIYFMATVGGSAELYRVSLGGELERLIGGEGVVDEFSAEGERVLYTYMTADSPKELYIYEGGKSEKLTSFNDAVKEALGFARPERFSFKASDGVEIEGWVLRPRGQGKTPWVLYIHGGPKTAYGWSFMFEFQLLASRGYAVVYTNPRGSDGYSEEFADIRCKYGERDYLDLMEAVDYALSRFDFLDEKRAAVAGGSYGGFMTNWIITHTDRFAAAITQRSICDWISMFGTTDIGWYFVEDQICCTPWRDREKCFEKSPLFYAKNAKTPTLVVHSIEDYRTWLDQGVAFYTALKLNGVDARLVLFPGESHELTRKGKPRHRVEDLRQKLYWLEKHLGGGAKA